MIKSNKERKKNLEEDKDAWKEKCKERKRKCGIAILIH